jgi:ATP-dependent Clp protease ATP-binding subunit ClpA
MEQLFRDRLRQVHSFADFVALWRRILADWAVSVPARYWERIRPHTRLGSLADPARRCIFFARSEASSFSRREITVEHLLLGVLREDPSLVSGAALEAVVRTIEASEPAGRRVPPMEDLRLSEEAIRVIAAAREIAHTAGRRKVAPADLARGILREANTLAARLLRHHMSDRA